MKFQELLGDSVVYIHSGPIDEESASSIVSWMANNGHQLRLTLVFMTFGGNMNYALAIHDAIKLMAASTEIHLVTLGTCQSAGTLIMNAVIRERRHTAPGTRFMVHAVATHVDYQTVVCEPRAPREEILREMSKNLGIDIAESYQLQEMWIRILQGGTNLDEAQIREMLKGETYFCAERALEYGLIGNILSDEPNLAPAPRKRRWYFLWLR